MITVHAPQVARSQTFLAPVSSRVLRSASSSVTRGSTSSLFAEPLIRRVTGTVPGPRILASAGANGFAAAVVARIGLDSATPAPRLMKARREKPFLGLVLGSADRAMNTSLRNDGVDRK